MVSPLIKNQDREFYQQEATASARAQHQFEIDVSERRYLHRLLVLHAWMQLLGHCRERRVRLSASQGPQGLVHLVRYTETIRAAAIKIRRPFFTLPEGFVYIFTQMTSGFWWRAHDRNLPQLWFRCRRVAECASRISRCNRIMGPYGPLNLLIMLPHACEIRMLVNC
jgi:hypothetical protein